MRRSTHKTTLTKTFLLLSISLTHLVWSETRTIVFQQIDYIHPTSSGDSIVWDFREIETQGIDYVVLSDSSAQGISHIVEHLTHYLIDSIVISQDNSSARITRSENESGTILYGIKDSLSVQSFSAIDANGVLRLPQVTTRASRTRRTVTTHLLHHKDLIVCLNTYVWYHPNLHQPLLASIEATLPDGSTAFRTSLLNNLPDSVARKIEHEYQEPTQNQKDSGCALRIYPNPVTNTLYIQLFEDQACIATLKLYNESGLLVRKIGRAHV